MNTSNQPPLPGVIVPAFGHSPGGKTSASALKPSGWRILWLVMLAGLWFGLANAPAARADQNPPGCTGSGLGILLYTSASDVHIGDTLTYSVTVFNGTGVGPVVCNATSITAFIITPDGISHPISLVRTNLSNGQSDYYPNVVSYVVRAQDILPNNTVASTATDSGVIHQNTTDSEGGGNQGVNTQVSLPCIGITAQCSGSTGENGVINFSGTVTNCGNDTLVNVTVTNFVNGGQFPVTFITNLLSGQVASFSGSYVPLNPCSPSMATLVAAGTDQYTAAPRTVTSSANTTCSDALTPGILVTKTCPALPVAPGQLLTFSGSVSNTGNVTLTGIIVVNNQPAPNTAVFTQASLAPGAVVYFTGSYLAPTNCSVTDTLTASAASTCGVPVTNTATATCPIVTTPLISVIQNCPVNPAAPGGLLTYSGSVSNAGNITLTNVVVLNNLSGATPVLTVAALAPSAVVNFTGSYLAPTNCLTISTATATGESTCGVSVTNTATTSCGINTTPALKVTQNCPVVPAVPGGLLTYSGTVTNTGNITLTNVVVLNNLSGATPIFTAVTLAPGVGAGFTGSYVAPANCSATSISTATGVSVCGVSVTNAVTSTCAVNTAPLMAITQSCPAIPAAPGGLLTYSGTVTNLGNITLTNVVVLNNQSGATPVFTAASLAPGAGGSFTGSYLAPTNCTSTSISTATSTSVCGVAVTNVVSSTCAINTTPVLNITQNCPVNSAAPGGLLTYSGTVTNAGDITLTNVVVLNNLSGATPVFRAATLAPGAGASFTGSYLAPTNCSTISIATVTGESTCGVSVTNTATTTCGINTTPALKVTQNCPVTPAVPGSLLTYSGTVTNTGNIALTNVVVLNNLSGAIPIFTAVTLAPGAGAGFTGSYVAPANCSVTSTSTATGVSVCGVAVTNAVTSTCAINTTPLMAITQSCPAVPAVPGGLLTYSGTVTNLGNITLTNVVVLNNQSGATPIFTAASLAPGAGGSFTGSYLAPTNCTSTSISTATSTSVCGVAVTNVVSSTCAINTTPVLNVTESCPANPTAPGALLTYSGTVTNAGNITITNVVVVSSVNGITPIFRAATLAPGAGTNFTGSYLTPTNCSSTSLLTASGESTCGVTMTNTASATCTILTTPQLSVTQTCPTGIVAPGGLLTFSGTVTNTGNITITNVSVVNNQAGVIFTTLSLAPGTGSGYTASYLAPTNCSSTSISTATGVSVCGISVTNVASSTCAIVTTPLITISQSCSGSPAVPGGLVTYSGSISNAGNITLTNVVILNNLSGATPIFTAIALAPSATASYSGSYLAPTNCFSTSVSTVTGLSVCGGPASASASSTCAIQTTPVLNVTESCPVVPTAPGQLLTYSGTVTNAGNITLTNVVVLNNLSGATPIFRATSLAPGVGTNFSGSYLTPTNCSTTSFVTASAQSTCGVTITNTATATCAIITTPALKVTQNCPAISVAPGALLTYGGTVTNTGNITITNVTVLNSQSGVIFTTGSLAPGVGASYTGSYLAPTNCSSTSTSTATGVSVCGVAVTNAATTTCTVITTPQLVISEFCPTNPAVPGGLLTYSGTVSNSGNIFLTNVVVLNNQSGNTPIYTAATLAPSQVVYFTGSYLAPTNCASTSVSTAIGQSICGVSVTNTTSITCQILTTPAIAVIQYCPGTALPPGGILTYTGTVSNTGNITLTNVIVVSDRPAANTVIFTAATLAPGASANFTGSYQIPLNCCVVFSTATATGQGCAGQTVSDSYTRTCTVLTSPSIVVTKTCPGGLLIPGGLLTYSGSVSNSGNITLVNVTVADNEAPGNPPIATPIDLAPGQSVSYTASYTIPPDFCGSDIVTASAQDVCTYLPVVNSVTTTCPITTSPAITVSMNCPAAPTLRGGLFTYTGSVSNAGNVSLVNVYVTDDEPTNNTPVIGPITIAPGSKVNFTNSYVAPTCCCLIIDTLTATGQGLCNHSNVTTTATAVCPLLSTPRIALVENCPPGPIPLGSAFAFSGYVTNTGDVVLTNVLVFGPLGTNNPVLGPISLAPGEAERYSGTYTTVFNTSAVTVMARGQEDCGGTLATNSASCVVATTPAITRSNGINSITFPTANGETYTVQYKNHLLDPAWTNLQTVNGTGANQTIMDTTAAGQPTRFYRVMVSP
jgi:uncharacterized repeat protein (TIGR01451 family)